MKPEEHAEEIGEQLGTESVGSVVTKVEDYCAHETRRIELVNKARIVALKSEGSLLLEEERAISERLRNEPPPGDLRSRRRKAMAVVVVLTIAGFMFSLVAFDPYRLGWKSYLYCLGIALVTPFLVDKFLEQWNARRLLRWTTLIAFMAALVSLVLLAVIRGNLLAQHFKDLPPAIVFDDSQPPSQTHVNFYDTTLALLRLVMALLAVAMELGAGLALHDAWRMLGEGGADWDALRERLAEVRARMVSNTFEITALQNEPAIYAARFWRNFYRAMLTHTMRNAMTKLLIVLAAVLPFARVRAATDVRRTVVIAIDLTASVGTRGPDRTTEFQKNIDGVTRFLGEAPAGSRVVVFSITDRSFAHPYILLSATIPEDEGYFGERLQSARTELVRVWRSRTRDLKPRYQKTDILGALLIASQVFSQTSPRAEKLLLIFSDMRQNTSELDLESLRLVPPFEKLSKEAKMIPQAQLHNVDVSILGVDGAGKSVAYWQSLEGFWSEYFQRNGARLLSYSALRELPR